MPWSPRQRRGSAAAARLLARREATRLALLHDAVHVRVAAFRDVALGRDESVLARRVQQAVAERADVGLRLQALRGTELPPPWLHDLTVPSAGAGVSPQPRSRAVARAVDAALRELRERVRERRRVPVPAHLPAQRARDPARDGGARARGDAARRA